MQQLRKIVKGSTLGLICPSSHPKTKEEVDNFISLLNKHGYQVKCGKSMYETKGYLAGSDELRAKDIMDMFIDDEVAGILCYKGGYGASRIVDKLDFTEIAKHPKLIMGFSDITVLLNSIYQFSNFPTFHGEMGVCMQNACDFTLNEFFSTIDGSFSKVRKNKNQTTYQVTNYNEPVEGILVGGNLSLVYALMGTPYELDLKDKILFLEDVDEAPYAIDRMFASLRLSGKLKDLKGIIFGSFSRCIGEDFEQSIPSLIEEYFSKLPIPIIAGFEAGHSKPFVTLPIGAMVRLNPVNGSVIVLNSLFIEENRTI